MATKLPSEDIIRNYRGNPFRSYQKQNTGKEVVLETLLNPEQQLELSRNKKADLVLAETLYQHGFWETTPKVYQHRSEEIISCCSSEKQVELNFLSHDSMLHLQKQNYPIIHIGMIMIGVYALHRQYYGSKVMIALVDSSDSSPEKATIGMMEVDMTKNQELCY